MLLSDIDKFYLFLRKITKFNKVQVFETTL